MMLHSSAESCRSVPLAPRANTRQRPLARALRARTVAAAADESERKEIYIGKGRKVTDDPRKYPDRDPGGLVGGWAGGEKELKDWAAVPFSAIDPSLQNALKKFSTPAKEAPQEGKDAIYVGKGKFVKGDARQYPDKELGGLTGGWAGGELGLKVDSSKFAAGTRVRVKGTLQPWMQNPLFARSNMALAGKEGVVSSARVDNGTLKVAVRVETGEAPVGQQADADVQWSRLVIFSDNELEVI